MVPVPTSPLRYSRSNSPTVHSTCRLHDFHWLERSRRRIFGDASSWCVWHPPTFCLSTHPALLLVRACLALKMQPHVVPDRPWTSSPEFMSPGLWGGEQTEIGRPQDAKINPVRSALLLVLWHLSPITRRLWRSCEVLVHISLNPHHTMSLTHHGLWSPLGTIPDWVRKF